MNTLITTLILSTLVTPQGQFRLAPDNLMPSKVVGARPAPTFLENILALDNGDLLVDSYMEGIVYLLKPEGTFTPFAVTGGKIAGISEIPTGGYVVSGWTAKEEACIYHVSSDGKSIKTYLISGGMFPNGVEHLSGDRFLVADSYAGVIWEYNASTHKVSVWKKDPTFARADLKDGTPGINGIRVWKGNLYFSNTNAHIFYLQKLGSNLQPVGTPVVQARNVNFDDFAIDGKGNVYATTHVLNSVQKLTPNGVLTTIAGLNEGMAGSTSATFGKTKATKNILYVATNGGLSVPPPGGVQPGKVVQITIIR